LVTWGRLNDEDFLVNPNTSQAEQEAHDADEDEDDPDVEFEPPSTFEATEALKVVRNYISFYDKVNEDATKNVIILERALEKNYFLQCNIQTKITDLKKNNSLMYFTTRLYYVSLLKSKLNGNNLTKAVNAYAVLLLTYSFGVIKLSKTNLQNINFKTRVLTKFSKHHPKSAIERFNLPRGNGGRGSSNSKYCNTIKLLH
jgi:hypothetical protein